MAVRSDDLIITIAYFSIPVQMIISLIRYPRLKSMDWKVRGIMVLFALFIFLCGAGHFLRCTERTNTSLFEYVNFMTALISMATALYLLPFVPTLMSRLDANIEALTTLNDDLRESKQQLMTFMAFLCHEIRNPLFAITSSITFLGDDLLSKEEATAELKNIGQSADLMLRLVNDVLDIAKFEAGKMDLEEHVFDLPQLLQGVSSSMSCHINSPAVRFAANFSTQLPYKVKGDSVRILQVLYNLLTNAKKFTNEGTISLQANLLNWSQSHGTQRATSQSPCSELDKVTLVELGNIPMGSFVVEFVVTDTGCGIPKHRIHHIFQPYAQSKLSDYRQHGGTGLGLSTISKLVHLMKGELSVQSSERVGSRFTVLVPLRTVVDDSECTSSVMDEEFVGLILSNSVSRTNTYTSRLKSSAGINNLFVAANDETTTPVLARPSDVTIHIRNDDEEMKEECRPEPIERPVPKKTSGKMYNGFDESTKSVLWTTTM